MYIENINGPADVKKLNIAQMTVLASEMRDALLTKLSRHGGHFGPNFGMVEATIALHYVFESPKDKFVFDVSHQSYPHKMLTGRKDAFLYEEHYDDVSGYSSPHESEHDHFTIGHTSTSVSLACGLAKGRDLKGEDGNVVAIIGDGSLSGGEALEALDYAAELDSNLIILVNDNDMSIAENLVLKETDSPKFSRGKGLRLNKRAIHDYAEEMVQKYDVRCTSVGQTVRSLSGGNQQKVIIGRWLLTEPDVLLLDEPTRGIDVGAKYEIYQLILDLANKGKTVIMVSSEMPELLGVCDRILVMSGGRLAGEVDAKTATQEDIMRLAAKYV